jgi:hypothetical protein
VAGKGILELVIMVEPCNGYLAHLFFQNGLKTKAQRCYAIMILASAAHETCRCSWLFLVALTYLQICRGSPNIYGNKYG